jgi:hypothetical protein
MLRVVQLIVVVTLASLCAVSQTQQPPMRSEANEPPTTGAITGRVVNENGQPVQGALVQIRAIGGNGQGQMATTDREGEFRVSNLDRATYIVSASMPAYTPAPRDPSTAAPTYRIGDSVNLTLIKGGVMTGTVTNAAGEPVVAVTVRVQMVRDSNGRRVPSGFSRQRSTDDRGVYRIYGLPAGTYVVVAGPATMFPSPEPNAYDGDAPTYAPSSTRDNATEVSVRAGEEVSGVDIRYRAEQGRTISGVVNTAPDVAFTVTLNAGGDAGAPVNTTFYQQPGNRDFFFSGVADGDYQLVVMSYARGSRNVSTASKRVTVKGADVTGLELTTLPLGIINGRVVLEESKTPECTDKQRPQFNEVVVAAWHNDNETAKETPQSLWSIGAPVPADADGSFVLRNLAPGEYYFVTRSPAKYWYLQSITFGAPPPSGAVRPAGRSSDATLVWTKVKAGDQLSGLTVTLAQGAASLRGQLVPGEGVQVPEKLFVYLVPSEREKSEAVLRFFAAPVSPDGKIALNNIPPGRDWILAQTFTEEGVTAITKIRLPHETETRARLRRDGEAAKTEVEFKPCQNVTDFQLPLKP